MVIWKIVLPLYSILITNTNSMGNITELPKEKMSKDEIIETLEKGIALLIKRQERMYSVEEVENILIEYVKTNPTKPYRVVSWFGQIKKK